MRDVVAKKYRSKPLRKPEFLQTTRQVGRLSATLQARPGGGTIISTPVRRLERLTHIQTVPAVLSAGTNNPAVDAGDSKMIAAWTGGDCAGAALLATTYIEAAARRR